MNPPTIEAALADITQKLLDMGRPFALVVARSEELLAMKILSMSDRRLQDQIDARNLVLYGGDLDIAAVKDNVDRIIARGYHRAQDLHAKLERILEVARREE